MDKLGSVGATTQFTIGMLFSDNFVGNVITLVVTFLVIFVVYFKWSFQYWSRRSVPSLEPQIPYGNFKGGLRGKEHVTVTLKKIYDEIKRKGWKYGGAYIYTTPTLIVVDLDLVRNILTKDFQYFAERGNYYNEKEPLQLHLANVTGKEWKDLRAKLTPTFTSGKMKMMFHVMAECEKDLCKRIEKECSKKKPVDIKEVVGCFTTNIIGTCGFGLDCQALEDENSEFRRMGRELFATSKYLNFKRTFAMGLPKLANFFNVYMFPKYLTNFFSNVVQDTIDYREKNNYKRNDFMQMMIDLKNNKSEDGRPFTFNDVASQCFIFFGAGFETSSTLMTFALYELSKHQDIQDKLRNEIKSVLAKHNDKITYDSIQEMTYLNQVVDETLRIHPPAARISRICSKEYKIPNTDVVIEKGTLVFISSLGIHYDQEYHPNPEKFNPDRFIEENKKSRHSYSFLPFGEGPRNCIGMRFGLLQAKVGLVSLLRNFKFTVNKKTQEPIVYDPNAAFVLSVQGEVWLDAEKI